MWVTTADTSGNPGANVRALTMLVTPSVEKVRGLVVYSGLASATGVVPSTV